MSDAPVPGLHLRYAKTEAGRAEIRNRALPLSRPARNLLLIIDPSRTAAAWLGLVRGCGPDALQALQDAGLLAPQPANSAEAVPRMSLAQALETKAGQTLQRRIDAEAQRLLGADAGRRLLDELARCSDDAQTRALAQVFVQQVRDADGDAAAIALARLLLAPG